jgi:ankyrin repeat protein
VYQAYGDIIVIAALVIAALAGLLRFWQGLLVVSFATIAATVALITDATLERFALPFTRTLPIFAAVYVTRHLVRFASRGWRQALAAASLFLLAAGAGVIAWGYYEPISAPPIARTLAHDIAEIFQPRCSRETVREVAIPPLPVFTTPAEQPLLTEIPAPYANAPVVKDAVDERQHFIGPYRAIRVPDLKPYASDDNPFHTEVKVSVIVGANGEVLAAVPTAGPSQLYAEAARLAKAWRFAPFEQDGVPTIVRIPDQRIAIDVTEKRPSKHAEFPKATDLESVVIRLKRNPSPWGGAGYEVTVRGDGSVTYEGGGDVALLGGHCAVIPRSAVERLVQEFRAANFFWLEDKYVASVFDIGSQTTTISIGGQTKSVFDYGSGWLPGTPDALRNLPNLLLHSIEANRWTHGDQFTVPSLVAEHWDFSRTDDANNAMVVGVAMFGETKALSDLLNRGAPIKSTGYRAGQSALEAAAWRGQQEMVRILLATPTQWPRAELSNALLSVSAQGKTELPRELMLRGADVNARGRDEKAPLIIAAEAGVPGVVDLLLQSKADIHTADKYGGSALHGVSWHHTDQTNAPPLDGVDRVKVVDLLIKAGIDVNATDKEGHTPLFDWWLSDEDVAAALIARGANVNARDADRATPLMSCKNSRVTLMILKAGADPFIKDRDNRTALDHAKGNGKETADVAAVLTQWMATHPQGKAPK